MAEAQLKFAEDYGLDCLLTCSDLPAKLSTLLARSVEWFQDQDRRSMRSGPPSATRHGSSNSKCPIPGNGRMYDRVKSIAFMRKQADPGMSIVGWIEGPLAWPRNCAPQYHHDRFFRRSRFCDRSPQLLRGCRAALCSSQIEAGADTMA